MGVHDREDRQSVVAGGGAPGQGPGRASPDSGLDACPGICKRVGREQREVFDVQDHAGDGGDVEVAVISVERALRAVATAAVTSARGGRAGV